MKMWNEKYGIDHDELEEKIFKLSEELEIMPHEADFNKPLCCWYLCLAQGI